MDTELDDELESELVDPYRGGLIGPIGEPDDAKLRVELDEPELGVGVGEGVWAPYTGGPADEDETPGLEELDRALVAEGEPDESTLDDGADVYAAGVLSEGSKGEEIELLPVAVYGGGVYCPDGVYWSGRPPLDILCIPILLDRLIVPVGAAEDELSGFTSEQGLATRRIGVHACGCWAAPRNWHSTCALSIRFTGDLQNLALPPVKRGLVQLRTPSLNVNVVLMEPGALVMENGPLSTLRLVDT
jgi:hypothetical protein